MRLTGSASRAWFLRRGLGLAAGAVGVGIAAQPAVAVGAPPAAGVAPEPTTKLVLHGRSVHVGGAARGRGARPSRGESLTVYGELVDARERRVGEFAAMAAPLRSPFLGSALDAVTFEQHVLHLGDGTLLGIGHAVDGEGTYAIVGGTGRYAGSRGSYTARTSVHGLGGDGTATFTITLTTA